MISVQNHRLRLSGSKSLFTVMVIYGIYSCAAPRPTANKPPVISPPVEKEEKFEVYDPKIDADILVPRDAIKVDTILWTEDVTPPIVTDKVISKEKPLKKGPYDVALLMPFNAINSAIFGEHQDPKLNRFIQYYAGMQLAIKEIDSLELPITVHSYDADAATTSIRNILESPEVKKASVIVGPYTKEDIELTASFGLANEIMVVSPWIPSLTREIENPFLLQIFPGLSTHAFAIMEFIKDEMSGKKVYVVARNTQSEINRIQLFTKSSDVIPEELIIKDSSPDLEKTNLHELMADDRGTIFILPYYAKSDEAFVNSFMRKLHAEKDTREAIVFGLPQWVGYTNLNANYMESLSLYLSISSFVDVTHPGYSSFRSAFLKAFHTVPDLNAFQGYDLMMWLAKSLAKGGQEGLIGYMDPTQYGLASGFDIKPVYRNDSTPTSEMKVPLYYENNRIRILHYVEQDYKLVR